jgi:hypothetical protein
MERKMADLIERYIHEVGRHLPEKERADIEAELRSQIQDQLEDRYGGAASQADVAAVLTELGDPRRMAASYAGEQYLIGPTLYPALMFTLRRGWVLIPPIVVVVRMLVALFDGTPRGLMELLVEAALAAAQATFLFSAIVVLIFAIIERSGEDLGEFTGKAHPFDPRTLPAVNDPAAVDRAEATFGVAFGAFMAVALLYFLSVGGLTLRFDRADPGDVIPAPVPWMIALLVFIVGELILQVVALLRGRWTIPLWAANMALELASAVGVYFVVLQPLMTGLLERAPQLANVPWIEHLPAMIVVVGAAISLVTDGARLVRMREHRLRAVL